MLKGRGGQVPGIRSQKAINVLDASDSCRYVLIIVGMPGRMRRPHQLVWSWHSTLTPTEIIIIVINRTENS